MKRRSFLASAAALAVSGCGAQAVWAPDADVQRVRYRHPNGPSYTLFTMKNVGSDNGAHTALMISASERVIFDPFGTFRGPGIPERNDVVFGINPAVLDYFVDFHARQTYYVITQHVPLQAAAAEDLYRRALVAGPVGAALCTTTTSRLLRETPGITGIRQTFFPDRLMRQVATQPGVVTKEWRDDDPDKASADLFAWVPGQPNRFNIE
ncbi:MAG: hypothetical protein AAF386_04195 [Pseudomonadota bacterium]